MHDVSSILINLFILFVAAKAAGIVFERLKQPAVIGELLAGIIIGPSALGFVHHSTVSDAVATLGVMILMFAVGLETRLSEMRKVGAQATIVALLGILFPFLSVYFLVLWLGGSTVSALFIGTACGATSVGITARVLSELGALQRKESKLIMAAAVLDDILVLLILTIITSYAKTHEFHLVDFSVALAQVLLFMVFATIVAPKIVRSRFHIIKAVRFHNSGLTIGLILMLGLSALSNYMGIAAIIGAFFAGMVFAESDDQKDILRQINPVFEFLVPFFFVVTGTLVDASILLQPSVIGAGVLITVLAIIGKVLSGLTIGRRIGWNKALTVGVGMVPRGEVGFIVASIGITLGSITQNDLSQVIFMSVATTLLVPPLLQRLIKSKKHVKLKEGIPQI